MSTIEYVFISMPLLASRFAFAVCMDGSLSFEKEAGTAALIALVSGSMAFSMALEWGSSTGGVHAAGALRVFVRRGNMSFNIFLL